MRAQRRITPATARTLSTFNTSSDFCDVLIAEEGITLRFERLPNGNVRCTGHMVENSDTSPRASRAGFDQARELAVQKMNKLASQEARREKTEEPIIESSSVSECVLTYAGKTYSYSCAPNLPLTWDNMRITGVFSKGFVSVHLTAEEERKLKMRALGRIKDRRREDYEDDGAGPLRRKTQLELLLERL